MFFEQAGHQFATRKGKFFGTLFGVVAFIIDIITVLFCVLYYYYSRIIEKHF